MSTLRFHDPAGVERTYSLEGDLVLFGRSDDCNLVLDAKGVSRQHGRFLRGGDGRWRVEDLGSKNGVLVAGRYVAEHTLTDGDVVTIGDLSLTFCSDRPPDTTMTRSAITISETLRKPSSIERHPGTITSMDARRLAAIYDVSRSLMNQRDVNGLIDVASASLVAELNAEVVVFGLTRDPEREPHRLLVRPVELEGASITLSRSVLRRTLDAHRAVVIADTQSDEALAFAQSIVAGGIRSALCVPLMRQEDVTGFIYVDSRRGGRAYDERDLEFAGAVGAMVGAAIENARLHQEELVKQRMEEELARARRVQQAILPSRWPALPGWDICGRHTTCREVGGDYYDAIVTGDGRLWLLIADVAGKGVPAALLASSLHAAIHAMIDDCSSPAHLLTRLNTLLLRRNLEASFVTCLAVLVAPATGETLLASAGHPYPIWVAADASPLPLTVESDYMLGIRGDAAYTDTPWSFPETPGTLLAYTDGVSEALDNAGDLFGQQRLLDALSRCGSASAEEAIDAVQNGVASFRGAQEQSDDLTLLACRRAPSA